MRKIKYTNEDGGHGNLHLGLQSNASYMHKMPTIYILPTTTNYYLHTPSEILKSTVYCVPYSTNTLQILYNNLQYIYSTIKTHSTIQTLLSTTLSQKYV